MDWYGKKFQIQSDPIKELKSCCVGTESDAAPAVCHCLSRQGPRQAGGAGEERKKSVSNNLRLTKYLEARRSSL